MSLHSNSAYLRTNRASGKINKIKKWLQIELSISALCTDKSHSLVVAYTRTDMNHRFALTRRAYRAPQALSNKICSGKWIFFPHIAPSQFQAAVTLFFPPPSQFLAVSDLVIPNPNGIPVLQVVLHGRGNANSLAVSFECSKICIRLVCVEQLLVEADAKDFGSIQEVVVTAAAATCTTRDWRPRYRILVWITRKGTQRSTHTDCRMGCCCSSCEYWQRTTPFS